MCSSENTNFLDLPSPFDAWIGYRNLRKELLKI